MAPVLCASCGRGREACQWCHDVEREDWESICDCGLYDFGQHLLDCRALADKRWVIAADHAAAEEPRA